MTHDQLYKIALKDVKNLSSDKSVSKKEIKSSLEALASVIEIKLGGLGEEPSPK